jgi:hypothetical protein
MANYQATTFRQQASHQLTIIIVVAESKRSLFTLYVDGQNRNTPKQSEANFNQFSRQLFSQKTVYL